MRVDSKRPKIVSHDALSLSRAHGARARGGVSPQLQCMMLRALLGMVSVREKGWQEPSASSLSGTHAGMPDYARLLSYLGKKPGEILDTGLVFNEVSRLAKNLRMELAAPASGLIQCMNRAGAAGGIKYGDPVVAFEMIHSNQMAAQAYLCGALFLEPSSTLYGGNGTEPFWGCFVSGTDEATLCYLVVRAVPALLKNAERRSSATQTQSDGNNAFASDCTTRSWAFERLAAIVLAHAHIDFPNVDYNFATRGQNAFNLALHLGAVFDSRNTVGGVSWLSAQLFDLTEEGWHGLPFTPRPTVLYIVSHDALSLSRAHGARARGGVSPQLQCMIKGDETRGVVACAYDAACGLCAPYATVRASAVRSNLVLRTLVADFSDEGDGFMLPALAALRCIHNRTVPDSQRV